MKQKQRGFTLIEVLVASVIFAIVASALGSLFQAGVQMSRRINYSHTSERAALAMAEIVEKRTEAREFSPLKLEEAHDNEFAFIGLAPGKLGTWQIGEIRYKVRDEKLLRQERTYAEVVMNTEGKTVEIADSITRLEAQDLFYNESTGQFDNEPVLGKAFEEVEETPDASRLVLRYKTADGKVHSLEWVFRV